MKNLKRKHKAICAALVMALMMSQADSLFSNIVYANNDVTPNEVEKIDNIDNKDMSDEALDESVKEEKIEGIDQTDKEIDNKKVADENTNKSEEVNKEKVKNSFTRATTTTPYSIDVTKGDVVISTTGVSIGGIPQANSISDQYIINGTSTNSVVINKDTTVIFEDLNLTTTATNPVSIRANVTILLSNENKLIAKGRANAGLHVQNGATLTIDSKSGTGSKDGKLSAFNTDVYNGARGAGIGTEQASSGGNITINGGTIEARGGAGIGGFNPGIITINNGDITALATRGETTTQAQYGVGIGSQQSTFKGIIINGGTIQATGGSGGAGIGSSKDGLGGPITINNGTIHAKGGSEAAGIGSGQSGTVVDITIIGGTIFAQGGGNVSIGNGGQEAATSGKIDIRGGIIECTEADAAIGDDYSKANSTKLDVSIENATITSPAVHMIVGKDVTIKGSTFTSTNTGASSVGNFNANNLLNIDNATINSKSNYVGTNGIMISNTTIKATYDKSKFYYAGTLTGAEIVLENNNIDMIGQINAKRKLDIKNSDIIVSQSGSTRPIQMTEAGTINIIGSKVVVEMGIITPATSNAFAIASMKGDLNIEKSTITGVAEASKDILKILSYCNNLVITESTVNTNMQVYGKETVDISSGYIKSTNTNSGVQGNNIRISGGYHEYTGAVYGHDVVISAGTGDGNAIVFASQYITDDNSPVKMEKGILFTNENNPDTPKQGYVYGDVELNHLIEENGTRFTLPEGYTLLLDENHQSKLSMSAGKEFLNNGIIENYKEINVRKDATFTNTEKGSITNHYGGYFVTDGTMQNKGVLHNAVYFNSIKLDDKDWDSYNEDTFQLQNTDGKITYVTDAGNRSPIFYALPGKNRILLNGSDTGMDIDTDWSFVDYAVDLYTISYDANYANATPITQQEIALAGSVYGLSLPMVERDGYDFKGWNTKADGSGSMVGNTITVSKATTLYAVWEKKTPLVETYVVTFDFKGGFFHGTENPDFTTTVFSDSDLLIKVYPYDTFVTKEGYTFTGWYKDSENKMKWDFKKDKVTGNMTLYAGWKKVEKPSEPEKPVKPEKPSKPEKPNKPTKPTKPGDHNWGSNDLPNNGSNPKTGDTTNMGLLVSLAGISLCFICLFGVKNKRSQNKK